MSEALTGATTDSYHFSADSRTGDLLAAVRELRTQLENHTQKAMLVEVTKLERYEMNHKQLLRAVIRANTPNATDEDIEEMVTSDDTLPRPLF